MDPVIAARTINSRLRVDSQEPELVQLRQLLRDDCRLARWRGVRPGKRLELANTELGEQRVNVGDRCRRVPKLERVLLGLLEPDSVSVEFAVCGRTRVSETTIGVLVPVLGTREVGARPVGPEDGTDGLGAAVGGEGLHHSGRVSQCGSEGARRSNRRRTCLHGRGLTTSTRGTRFSSSSNIRQPFSRFMV